MNEKQYFDGNLNPFTMFSCMAFNLAFRRDNPNYFDPDGIWCFCGAQGSGKTLSAVQTLLRVAAEYPKALICSNLVVHGLDASCIYAFCT